MSEAFMRLGATCESVARIIGDVATDFEKSRRRAVSLYMTRKHLESLRKREQD